MLKLIFTIDYEVHGNGDGDPAHLMVEAVDRCLGLFQEFGAKLTVMAEAAELIRFKEYWEQTGRDDFRFQDISTQLRRLVQEGHDVQLHLHPSYFNARLVEGRWRQDWSEYDFAKLPFERMGEYLRRGRGLLESIIRPVDPDYRCRVFRAANWSMVPSSNAIRALVSEGFLADSSVFKYGQRRGLISFDYSAAHHALMPWRPSEEAICRHDPEGLLLEFPIYCEERYLSSFLHWMRVYNSWKTRRHRVPLQEPDGPAVQEHFRMRSGWVFGKHAWKADLNQCSGRQLIKALVRASKLYDNSPDPLPFVLIGHSKLFHPGWARSFRPLFEFVKSHSTMFGYGLFSDFLTVPRNHLKRPLAA